MAFVDFYFIVDNERFHIVYANSNFISFCKFSLSLVQLDDVRELKLRILK